MTIRPPALLLLACILLVPPSRPVVAAQDQLGFAQWEPDIAAFEQRDAVSPPPKGAVLFVGSSTITRWGSLAQDFPDVDVINRGFGGSQIVDVTHFAGRIIFPYQPRMILLRSGCNDLNSGKSPEQVFADFKDFVTRVHENLPYTQIAYISLSPSIVRWNDAAATRKLNSLVQEYVRQTPLLLYIDCYDISLGTDGKARSDLFAPDKLHFDAAGYKLLAARIRPYLPKKPL